MSPPQAVLDRIARLRALADRGATEHERALAATKADELVARHGLQASAGHRCDPPRTQSDPPPPPTPTPPRPFVADGIVITINFDGGLPTSTATGTGTFTSYRFGFGAYR